MHGRKNIKLRILKFHKRHGNTYIKKLASYFGKCLHRKDVSTGTSAMMSIANHITSYVIRTTIQESIRKAVSSVSGKQPQRPRAFTTISYRTLEQVALNFHPY